MLRLLFVPTKLPRTMTRKEWYECWRWKRITEKQLNEIIEERTRDFVAFGNTWSKQMCDDFIDNIINIPF